MAFIGAYKRVITLSPATPEADFQVKVELTPDNFNYNRTKPNGEDLRFYQPDGTLLPYWIEKWDTLGTSIIWVKVQTAGVDQLDMFYGNPLAEAASSVSNTFIREIDGLIGSWHMDEGTGDTTKDTSGYGNDGTITGATWGDGYYGKALHYDGDDYVNCGNAEVLDNTQPIAVEMRVLFESLPDAYVYLVDKYQAAYKGYRLREEKTTGYITFLIYDGSAEYYILSNTKVTTNEWYHIVSGYDGADLHIYLNGTSDASKSVNITRAYGTSDLRLGNSHVGYQDEVRIYNRFPTAEEIVDLANYYGYTTVNYPGKVLVRKWADPMPTATVGDEIALITESITLNSVITREVTLKSKLR